MSTEETPPSVEERIARALESIADSLAKIANPPMRVPPGATRSPLLSGSWPRRDGTGYAPLVPPKEEPGHGAGEHPAGDLRSPPSR